MALRSLTVAGSREDRAARCTDPVYRPTIHRTRTCRPPLDPHHASAPSPTCKVTRTLETTSHRARHHRCHSCCSRHGEHPSRPARSLVPTPTRIFWANVWRGRGSDGTSPGSVAPPAANTFSQTSCTTIPQRGEDFGTGSDGGTRTASARTWRARGGNPIPDTFSGFRSNTWKFCLSAWRRSPRPVEVSPML